MPNLLLLGAGHAHMTVMEAIPRLIERGHSVTVVGPGERHYYSGMGPGMLGGHYSPEDISFPVRQMVTQRGGTFITARATRIDPQRKHVVLDSGQELAYDVCSCNTGSHVPSSIVDGDATDVFPVKPIENLLAGRGSIRRRASRGAVRIAVVGGGPAALEVAGNAATALTQTGAQGNVAMYAGSSFLRRFPARVRELARKELQKARVKLHEGAYASAVHTGEVVLDNGERYEADIIFTALGVVPSPLFAASGLPVGKDGGLAVDAHLRCTEYDDIFGGGDCIWFTPQPLAKVGVYAVRQNPVLLHNLAARLEGGPLLTFSPGGEYLLIFNTGSGRGILHKAGFTFAGRLAFMVKDWIDRRFIRRFQLH